MSSSTKKIYDEYIKPLSREEQLLLLNILQTELNAGEDNIGGRSILDLQGLGQEIWQEVEPEDYVRGLREEWDERVG